MDRILGLLALAVYITAVVGLAALVTYAVIRIFPTQRTPQKPDAPDQRPDEGSMGRLFRRAKRGTA